MLTHKTKCRLKFVNHHFVKMPEEWEKISVEHPYTNREHANWSGLQEGKGKKPLQNFMYFLQEKPERHHGNLYPWIYMKNAMPKAENKLDL